MVVKLMKFVRKHRFQTPSMGEGTLILVYLKCCKTGRSRNRMTGVSVPVK